MTDNPLDVGHPFTNRIDDLEEALRWALVQLVGDGYGNKPRFFIIDYWRAKAVLANRSPNKDAA